MLSRIGIWIVGLTSLALFVLAALLMLFRLKLESIYPAPPLWVWYTLIALSVIGLLGFVVGVIGRLIED